MQAERAVVRKQFSRRVCSWSQIPRVSLAPKPCEAQPSAEGAVKRHPPTGPSDDQQGLQEKPTDLLVGRFGHPAPPLRAQVLTSQRTPLQSRVLLAVSLNRPPPPRFPVESSQQGPPGTPSEHQSRIHSTGAKHSAGQDTYFQVMDIPLLRKKSGVSLLGLQFSCSTSPSRD